MGGIWGGGRYCPRIDSGVEGKRGELHRLLRSPLALIGSGGLGEGLVVARSGGCDGGTGGGGSRGDG